MWPSDFYTDINKCEPVHSLASLHAPQVRALTTRQRGDESFATLGELCGICVATEGTVWQMYVKCGNCVANVWRLRELCGKCVVTERTVWHMCGKCVVTVGTV